MRRLYDPTPEREAAARARQDFEHGITCPECSRQITNDHPSHASKCGLSVMLASALERFDESNWPSPVSERFHISYADARRLCPTTLPLGARQLAADTVEAARRAGETTHAMLDAFKVERDAEAALLAATLAMVSVSLDAIVHPIRWAPDDALRGVRLLGRQPPPDDPSAAGAALVALRVELLEHGRDLAEVTYRPAAEPDKWIADVRRISYAEACKTWQLMPILAALHDAFDRVAEGNAVRRAAEARARAEMLVAITTLVRGMRAQPPPGASKRARAKAR